MPLRASAVFAAIDSATAPLPVPLAPLLIITHPALLAAVHPHVDADAVTATDALPPPAATLWLDGEIENVHGGGGGGGAPACVTVTPTPAMVSEPLRSPPLFAAAVNAVDPAPVPDAPPVMVIHGAPLDAVHVQVDDEGEIAKLPLPPPVATACVEGDTLNVHGGGGGGGGAAPAWFTVKVWPPIVTVPLRATSLFAAAATVMLPLPVPLAPAVTLSHPTFAVAVHEHDDPLAVTAVVALPPSGGSLALDGEIENVHDGAAAV